VLEVLCNTLTRNRLKRKSVKSAHPPPSESFKTYRIRGIPIHYSRSDVIRTLKQEFRLNDTSKFKLGSLAQDPRSSSLRSLVATFDVKEGINILPKGQDSWSYDIPYNRVSSHEDGEEEVGNASIEIDTHFRGFTPFGQYRDEVVYDVE
jgi:hypothetical protein